MKYERTYNKRRRMGVCVDCGDPALHDGHIRCHKCMIISRAKANVYRNSLSDERRKVIYQRNKAWFAEHPEKVAEYKERYKDRKSEYNRRYREGCEY